MRVSRIVFLLGGRTVGQRCRSTVIVGAEYYLDFVHRLSFGLGNEGAHEERAQQAEHREHPERLTVADIVYQYREELRDQEGKKPVSHTSDRASGACDLKKKQSIRVIQFYSDGVGENKKTHLLSAPVISRRSTSTGWGRNQQRTRL